ncbi:MAG: hypothetical protein CVT49_07445 [candidate division Zixibacteria bacterium HGW-Zixibacteria-1]|nr:MAG: hypothetical protein CVT49_07445 [candidate division Zixibacteria bacterium HGW-Zixibacteria-1]
MKLRNLKFLIFLIVILVAGKQAKATDINQDLNANEVVERNAILDKAISLTGFYANRDECKISAEDVQLVLHEDSTTPFLGEFGTKRAVWHIAFHNINLNSKEGRPADQKFDRDFDVYIDSASGHLLKIICNYDNGSPEECPILLAEDAEKQINSRGEKYVGLPEVIPEISFTDAALAGPPKPWIAKEILGQYVIYTDGRCEPRPVWIISMCGPIVPVIGGSAEWIPDYQRNRCRKVVDAKYGNVFFVTNTPKVPLTPEDRKRILGK